MSTVPGKRVSSGLRWRWRWRWRWGAVLLVVWAATMHGGAGAASNGLNPEPIFDGPVQPVSVARLFDPPPEPWNAGHRGIDLSASPGQEVRSPGAGEVTFAGYVVDRGVITVLHPNGLRSSLEPVEWQVSVGDHVSAGQTLGVVQEGSTHCAPHACLHWGLRHGDEYLNPLDWFVGFGPVRLLPLHEGVS